MAGSQREVLCCAHGERRLLGAFLASPAAGVVQLVAREVAEGRRMRKLLLP